jgi:hypothetical protein
MESPRHGAPLLIGLGSVQLLIRRWDPRPHPPRPGDVIPGHSDQALQADHAPFTAQIAPPDVTQEAHHPDL